MGVKMGPFDTIGTAEWYLQLLQSKQFEDLAKKGTADSGNFETLRNEGVETLLELDGTKSASEADFIKYLQGCKDASTREQLYKRSTFFGYTAKTDGASFDFNNVAELDAMKAILQESEYWVVMGNSALDQALENPAASLLDAKAGKVDPNGWHRYQVQTVAGQKILTVETDPGAHSGAYSRVTASSTGLTAAAYQKLVAAYDSLRADQQEVGAAAGTVAVYDDCAVSVFGTTGGSAEAFLSHQLGSPTNANAASVTLDLTGIVSPIVARNAAAYPQAVKNAALNAMIGLAANGKLAGATDVDFAGMKVTLPAEQAHAFILRLVGKDVTPSIRTQAGVVPYKGGPGYTRNFFINDTDKTTNHTKNEIVSNRHTFWKFYDTIFADKLAAQAPAPTKAVQFGDMKEIYDSTLVLPIVVDDYGKTKILPLQAMVGLDEQTMLLDKDRTLAAVQALVAQIRLGTYTPPEGYRAATEAETRAYLDEVQNKFVNVSLKSLQTVDVDQYGQNPDPERENSVYVMNDPHMVRMGRSLQSGASVAQPYLTVDLFFQPASAYEDYKSNDVNTPLNYEQAALLGTFADAVKSDYKVKMRRLSGDATSGQYAVYYDKLIFTDTIATLDKKIADGTFGEMNYLGKPLTLEGAHLMRDAMFDATERDRFDWGCWNPLTTAMVGGESYRKWKEYSAQLIEENNIYTLMFLPETALGLLSFAASGVLVYKTPWLGRKLIKWQGEVSAGTQRATVEHQDALAAARREGQLDAERGAARGGAVGDMLADDVRPVLDSSGTAQEPVYGADGKVKVNAAGKPYYRQKVPFSNIYREVLGEWGLSPKERVVAGAKGDGAQRALDYLAEGAAYADMPDELIAKGARGHGRIQAAVTTDPANLDASRRVFEARQVSPELTRKLELTLLQTPEELAASGNALTTEEKATLSTIIDSKMDKDIPLTEAENKFFVERKCESLLVRRQRELTAGRQERVIDENVPKLFDILWNQSKKASGEPLSVMIESELGGTQKTWLAIKAAMDALILGNFEEGVPLSSRYTDDQIKFFKNQMLILDGDFMNLFSSAYVNSAQKITNQLCIYVTNMRARQKSVWFFVDELGRALSSRIGGGDTPASDILMAPLGDGRLPFIGTMTRASTRDVLTSVGELMRRFAPLFIGDRTEKEVMRGLKASIQQFIKAGRIKADQLGAPAEVTAYLNDKTGRVAVPARLAEFFSEIRKIAYSLHGSSIADPARSKQVLRDYIQSDDGWAKVVADGKDPMSPAAFLDFMRFQVQQESEKLSEEIRKLDKPISEKYALEARSEELVLQETHPDFIFKDNLEEVLKLKPNGERSALQHNYDLHKLKACVELMIQEAKRVEALGGDPAVVRSFTRKYMLFKMHGLDAFRSVPVTRQAKKSGIAGLLGQTEEVSDVQYVFNYDTETMARVTVTEAQTQRALERFLKRHKIPDAEQQKYRDALKTKIDAINALPDNVDVEKGNMLETLAIELDKDWSAENPTEVFAELMVYADNTVETTGRASEAKAARAAEAAARASEPTADPAPTPEPPSVPADPVDTARPPVDPAPTGDPAPADATDPADDLKLEEEALPREFDPVAEEIWTRGKGGKPAFKAIVEGMGMPEAMQAQTLAWLDEQVKVPRDFTTSIDALKALRAQQAGLPDPLKGFVSDLDRLMKAGVTNTEKLKAILNEPDSVKRASLIVDAETRARGPRASLYQEGDEVPSTARRAKPFRVDFDDPTGSSAPDHRSAYERGADADIAAWKEAEGYQNLEDAARGIEQAEAKAPVDAVAANPAEAGEVVDEALARGDADGNVIEPSAADGVTEDAAPLAEKPTPIIPEEAALAKPTVGARAVGFAKAGAGHAANFGIPMAAGIGTELLLSGAENLTGHEFAPSVHTGANLGVSTEVMYSTSQLVEGLAKGPLAAQAITRPVSYGAFVRTMPVFFFGDHLAKVVGVSTGLVDEGSTGQTLVGLVGGMSMSWVAEAAIQRWAPQALGKFNMVGAAVGGAYVVYQADGDPVEIAKGVGSFAVGSAAAALLRQAAPRLAPLALEAVGPLLGPAALVAACWPGAAGNASMNDLGLLAADREGINETAMDQLNQNLGLVGDDQKLDYDAMIVILTQYLGVGEDPNEKPRNQEAHQILLCLASNVRELEDFKSMTEAVVSARARGLNDTQAREVLKKSPYYLHDEAEMDLVMLGADDYEAGVIAYFKQFVMPHNAEFIKSLKNPLAKVAIRVLLEQTIGKCALSDPDRALVDTRNVNPDSNPELLLAGYMRGFIRQDADDVSYFQDLMYGVTESDTTEEVVEEPAAPTEEYVESDVDGDGQLSPWEQATYENEADLDGDGYVDDVEQFQYEQDNAPLAAAQSTTRPPVSSAAPTTKVEQKDGYTDYTYTDEFGEYGESVEDEEDFPNS